MAKLSDYKYRKARKIVRETKVRQGVKDLMFCALKQYKKGVEPETGVFQRDFSTDGSGKQACLVGAGLAARIGFTGHTNEPKGGWETAASKEFKIPLAQVNNIIIGFNSFKTDVVTGTTAKLAQTISKLLDVSQDDPYRSDDDDDEI